MRKVLAATFVSLDGVIQAPGAPEEDTAGGFEFGGWTFPHWDDVMGESLGKTFDTPFDLLLGRRTYDIFAAHWPYIDDSDPIAKSFNAVTKYVATRSDRPLTWNNSVALRDAASEVARLKQQDGPVLLIQGSSDLIQTLLAHNLVDEFRLLVFPTLLGRGKKLFGTGTQPLGLKLLESKVSTTGVIISTYVPAGQVKTGSFATQPPSEAELERRARVAGEG